MLLQGNYFVAAGIEMPMILLGTLLGHTIHPVVCRLSPASLAHLLAFVIR